MLGHRHRPKLASWQILKHTLDPVVLTFYGHVTIAVVFCRVIFLHGNNHVFSCVTQVSLINYQLCGLPFMNRGKFFRPLNHLPILQPLKFYIFSSQLTVQASFALLLDSDIFQVSNKLNWRSLSEKKRHPTYDDKGCIMLSQQAR